MVVATSAEQCIKALLGAGDLKHVLPPESTQKNLRYLWKFLFLNGLRCVTGASDGTRFRECR